MALVRSTENAQFTPAGVLKVPLSASRSPEQVLEELEAMLKELTEEEPAVAKK
jgi:hypothetical protein